MASLSPTVARPLVISKSSTDHCAPAQSVGFDDLDKSALLSIEPALLGDITPLKIASTAIANEGAYGPAMRRLLAREVTIARARLRALEAIANIEAVRFLKNQSDRRNVDVIERAVERASRRLHAAIDRLAALDAQPVVQLNMAVGQLRVEVKR